MSSGPFYHPGLYVCRVKEQAFAETKNGNPMIVLAMEPTHLLDKDSEGNEMLSTLTQSYERTVRLVIANDDQKEYVMLKLRNAGFLGDSFSQLNLEGGDVRCVCEHRQGDGEYTGKTFEQWDLQLPPRERIPLQPLDKTAARKLDAMFGKRLKEGAKKPAAAPVAAVESNNGDDPPF